MVDTPANDVQPSQRQAARQASRRKPFGWLPLAFLAWLIVFGTYEWVERTYFGGADAELLHLRHILRGTGTSFLIAGLVAWYILREQTSAATPAPGPGGLRTILAESEAKELIIQELWVIRLRWIAISGVTATTLVCWRPLGMLSPPSAIALFLIALVMAGYNAWFEFDRPREGNRVHGAFAQVFLDLTALTLMLYFSGGIHNPFFLFYVFHIVIAGILLRKGQTYLVTSVACLLFCGMVLLQEFGWIPTYPLVLGPGVELRLAQSGAHVLGVLTAFVATACCTAYLTTTIMSKLRRRGEEILEAGEILSQERAKTDNIVRSVGAGLLLLDRGDQIVWANEIAKNWFGNGLEGGPCYQRLWQQGPPHCPECPIRLTLRTGQTQACEQSAVLQGRRRFFLTSSSLIHSADGNVENILVLVQDITAMKEMQIQLVQAGKMVAVGQLAAGIAHEINNPLAVVASSAEILLEEEHENGLSPEARREQLERHLKKIEDNVFRCKSIIQNLLGFTRRDGEGAESVDVAMLLDETVSLVEGTDRARDRKIVRETPRWPEGLGNRKTGLAPAAPEASGVGREDLVLVRSRPRQIQQVVLNLMLNALDAVGPGGQVRFSARPSGEGVEISVADQGQGIPPEHLDRIFEPFFTTKPPGKGTGLGLYISHQIVESLNGTISVDSRRGQGTVFRVWLPRDSAIPARGPAS